MPGRIEITGGGSRGPAYGRATYWGLTMHGWRPSVEHVYAELDHRDVIPDAPSSRQVWDVRVVYEGKTSAEYRFDQRW